MVAFAARYGNAPPNVTASMEVIDLLDFNSALARLIESEAEAVRKGSKG